MQKKREKALVQPVTPKQKPAKKGKKENKKNKVWRNCPPNLSISLSGVKRK